MCGINGFNFRDKDVIREMNASIKHRGPDNEDSFVNDSVSLGHQRLAIIDLSKEGNQPMGYSHDNSSATIVYNGEIYNFKEIKKELEGSGHKFKSNSDTEVILASYLEWGTDCVKKFNGMWAFCIYDSQKNIFFLSRDRLGQKPLYYFFNEEKFIFSSELKGILKHDMGLHLKREAIDLYFSLGFIPSPYSIYENIFKVEAAQNVILKLDKKTIHKEKYFEYPSYSPIYNKKKLKEEFDRLFEDASKLRLISDVPLGAFLSGGIDSSLVVKKLEFLLEDKKLSTFSIQMKASDDAKYVEIFKKQADLQNKVKTFEEKDLNELMPKIFYYYDEPFADYSMFPSYDLSEMTSKKITVALSGDGADEFFGGYGHYNTVAKIALLKKIPRILRNFLITIIPDSKKTKLLREGIKVSLHSSKDIFAESMTEIYKPEIYKKITSKKMEECLEISKGDLVEAAILFDRYFKTMGDNFLCKVDRASMANSLEVRSPFLDYRFIEYASKIPSKWKANKFSTKILLKEMIKGTLPEEIINRKKEGFNSSELEKMILRRKSPEELKNIVLNLFDKSIISKEWKEFYIRKIIPSNDPSNNKFKIRVILFYDWLLRWEKRIATKENKNL